MIANEMQAVHDMLQKQLNVIRNAQAAALQVIVRYKPKVEKDKSITQPAFEEEYWKATAELKRLMAEEAALVKQMSRIDPDLYFEPTNTYGFDEKGRLKIV